MRILFGKQIFISTYLVCLSGCAYFSPHPKLEKNLEALDEEVPCDVFHESAHLLQERVNQ